MVWFGLVVLYCLGVNLSATMKPMHPKKLHSLIYSNNKALFDAFLDFPKVWIFFIIWKRLQLDFRIGGNNSYVNKNSAKKI